MFSERELIKESLDELFRWIGEGTIKVAKVTEYKLKDVSKAHRDLESGNTVGKLVLLTQDTDSDETKTEEKETQKQNDVDDSKAEDVELLKA